MKYKNNITIEGEITELQHPIGNSIAFTLVNTLLFSPDVSTATKIKILVVYLGNPVIDVEEGQTVTVQGYINQASNGTHFIHAERIILCATK